MYPISLVANKESKLTIHLDGITELRVPGVVFAGIGNKKTRYTNYLEKCFKNNQKLLHMLCRLHVEGYKNGEATLICHKKVKDFHGVCIKEFLEKNDDFLKSIIPYVFPKMELPKELKTDQATQNLTDDQKAEFGSMFQNNETTTIPAQLTEDDMSQIRALIEGDQARQEITWEINYFLDSDNNEQTKGV